MPRLSSIHMLAVLALAALLAGCGLTPSQKFSVVAGVLIVGAVIAHGDGNHQEGTRQPQCLPNNPVHACQ